MQIEQYEIKRLVGQGAMGFVYEAVQQGLDRKVAVKVLPSPLAQDRSYVKRFRNEAAAAARMSHPNIATVYDYGEAESGPYLVMEYIEGRTLEQMMSAGRLSLEQAADISEKIADALHYAHQHGIIHRDIKSANVMLDESNRTVIMDFGLAKIENATLLTLDGTIMGTPGYMAPELAQCDPDRKVSGGVDIYSLGVLMYEMFTGEMPFTGSSHLAVLKKALEEDPVPPRRLNAKIPRDIEVIILKAMEKDPQHRYGTALELAGDLRRVKTGEPILARRTSILMRIYRKSRKFKAVFAALALAGVVALGWTAYLVAVHRRQQAQYEKILGEAREGLTKAQKEREVLLEKISQDPLFSVLESRDPLMRAQAMIALNQRLREKELKGKLRQDSFDLTMKALEDPHPLVRRHAAILLGILKDARASGALIRRIQDEDPEVRKHAVLALGLLQETRAAPKIIESLRDMNQDVRANAALSLGLLKTGGAVLPLAESLADPFPTVRANAALALGSIRDSRSIPALVSLLHDSVLEVRRSAEEALSNFGDEARLPMLLAALGDKGSDPREIVKALRRIDPDQDAGAFDAVLELLAHEDKDVRYNAVLILGLFRDIRAVEPLIEKLEDSEPSVRENARLALIGLTGADFGFDMEKWKEDWSRDQSDSSL